MEFPCAQQLGRSNATVSCVSHRGQLPTVHFRRHCDLRFWSPVSLVEPSSHNEQVSFFAIAAPNFEVAATMVFLNLKRTYPPSVKASANRQMWARRDITILLQSSNNTGKTVLSIIVLCVEWCKARARHNRWAEEMQFLLDVM